MNRDRRQLMSSSIRATRLSSSRLASVAGVALAMVIAEAAWGQSSPPPDEASGRPADIRLNYRGGVARQAAPADPAGQIFWTNSAGGFFQDQDNWSAGVPGAFDSVVFDLTGTTYTVDFVDPAESYSVRIGKNDVTFRLSGFDYMIGDGGLQVGTFGQASGRLTIREGTMFVSGDLLVDYGQLRVGYDAAVFGYSTLTMSSTSGIAIELDENASPAFGVPALEVETQLTLDGVLVLNLGPNADPDTGIEFTLLNAPEIAGSFGVILTPGFPATNPLRYLNIHGTGFPRIAGGLDAKDAAGTGPVTTTVEDLVDDVEFDPPVTDVVSGEPRDAAVADFDGATGNDVILAIDGVPGGVKILTNDGTGLNFSEGSLITTGNNPVAVATGEFDALNGPDAVVANEGEDSISILLNLGSGNLAVSDTIGVGRSPSDVAVGDVTNDGAPDILVANRGDNNVEVFVNDGSGAFSSMGTVSTGAGPRSLALAHFNFDGQLDLAVANETDNTVQVFLNAGGGAFSLQSTTTVAASPGLMDPEDLDNDKDTDIVVTNGTNGRVTILRNDGGAGFRISTLIMSATDFPAGVQPSSIAVADLDEDGDKDLAVVQGTSSTRVIRIYRNDTPSLTSTNPLVFATASDLIMDNSLFLGIIAPLDGNSRPDLIGVGTTVLAAGPGTSRVAGIAGKVDFLLNVSGAPCPEDISGDRQVTVTDLLSLLAAWGPCPPSPQACPEDVNADGSVTVLDLLDLLAAWGACP